MIVHFEESPPTKKLRALTSMAAFVRENKVILLVVDPQIDFHEGGSLAVQGADDDSARTAQFIKRNVDNIDEIYVTLDSHHRNHIAHSIFWINDAGETPVPFTLITNEDVVSGKWRPRNPSFREHCLQYTKYLEDQGKYVLCIWPEHCLIGSIGHSVVPVLHDALQEWTGLKGKDIHFLHKGQNCLTEMYSAIKADFEIESDSRTQRDPELVRTLQDTDKLFVCGQALSHCVKATFMDILETWPAEATDKLVLLSDASSPVAGFEQQGRDFVATILARGCSLATTLDPLSCEDEQTECRLPSCAKSSAPAPASEPIPAPATNTSN